jgi:uncharacterized membrane protein
MVLRWTLVCSVGLLISCGSTARDPSVTPEDPAAGDVPAPPRPPDPPPATDAPSAPAPSTGYHITALPLVDGHVTFPTALNERGDVVGIYVAPPRNPPDCIACGTYSFPRRAFFYDGSTGIAERIADDVVSGSQFAADVNEQRQVAIYTCEWEECLGHVRGYRWQGGVLTPTGALTEAPSGDVQVYGFWAFGIDAKGRVLGWSRDAAGAGHTVVWDAGTLQDLGSQSDFSALSPAHSVFDSEGDVVIGDHGRLVLVGGGERHPIAELGGLFFDPAAMNDSGTVVGRTIDLENYMEQRAFVLEVSTGTLRRPIGRESRLRAVNASGVAVGEIISEQPGSASRAILWSGVEVVDLTDALGDPAWELISATAINDRGEIAGTGRLSGERRGFLITPR